jgi:hypothetical protein
MDNDEITEVIEIDPNDVPEEIRRAMQRSQDHPELRRPRPERRGA